MKKLVCVFVLTVMTVTAAFSQIQKINSRIAELKISGVDTLITYYSHGVWDHYDLSKKGCQSFRQKYLIWFKDGKNYIQLFDECYTYNVLPDGVPELVDLIRTHMPEITKQEIKHVQYKMMYNGKEALFTTYVTDTFQWDFEFYTGSSVLKKSIDSYALDTEYVEGSLLEKGKKAYNVNYTYNQNTYLNRIKNIIEKDAKGLQFQQQ